MRVVLLIKVVIFLFELTLAENECDKEKDILLEDGNMGLSSDFSWLGLLKVFLNDGDEDQVAVTGVVLIKPCYALASADDVARIPKLIFKNDTQVVFIADGDVQVSYSPISYVVHPEYQAETFTSIALVELDVGNDTQLIPICFPTIAFDSTHLYLAGFTDENKILEKMFYRVLHTDKQECEDFYQKEGLSDSSRQPASYLCGHWQRANRSCVCETGMALVSNSSGWFTLIGFSVYGPGCAAPARFINMLYYIPWIHDVIHDLGSTSVETYDYLSPDYDFDTEYVPIHRTFTSFNVVPNDYRYRRQQYELNQKINRRFGLGTNYRPDPLLESSHPYGPDPRLWPEDTSAEMSPYQHRKQLQPDQKPQQRFGSSQNYGPDPYYGQNYPYGPDPRLWPPDPNTYNFGNNKNYNLPKNYYGAKQYYGPTHLYPDMKYFGPNEYFWPYLPSGGKQPPFVPLDIVIPQKGITNLNFMKWPFPVDTLQHFRIESAYYDPSILFIVTFDTKRGLYGSTRSCYAKNRILKYEEEFNLNVTKHMTGNVTYRLSTYDMKKHGITCVALYLKCTSSTRVHIAFREESIASFLYDAEDRTQPTPEELIVTEKIRTEDRNSKEAKYKPEYMPLDGPGIKRPILTYELGLRFSFDTKTKLRFKLFTSPKANRGVYNEWKRPFYSPGRKTYMRANISRRKKTKWKFSKRVVDKTVREAALVAEHTVALDTASKGDCREAALKLIVVSCLLKAIFI